MDAFLNDIIPKMITISFVSLSIEEISFVLKASVASSAAGFSSDSTKEFEAASKFALHTQVIHSKDMIRGKGIRHFPGKAVYESTLLLH